MKIRHLEIEHFRGIDSLSCSFLNPATGKPLDTVVFAGPNGCGKTSVLEACICGLLRDDSLLTQKGKSGNAQKGSENFTVKVQYSDANGGDHTYTLSNDTLNKGKTDLAERIQYYSSWRYPEKKGPLSITVGKKGKRPYETEANRLWLFRQYIVDAVARDAMEQAQGKQDNFPSIPRASRDLLDKLGQYWAMFYPSQSSSFQVFPIGREIEDGFELFLVDQAKSGEPIPVESLSSGEIEAIVFIGSLLRRPLNDGILFIDEPELHLHPTWHRIILQVLRKLVPADTQIICATHSTDILKSVMDCERFVLRPDADFRPLADSSVTGIMQ
jgi:predicted ATPase